jgi:hypothetical protein
LPHASVNYWVDGYFLKAGRAGFVGSSNNQSLLGTLTRFAGSVAGGHNLWIAAAIVVGVLGLAAGALLHRAGRGFEGVMAVALTALLISPISWDAHWVWVGPGLALLVSGAIRAERGPARAAWAGVAAFVAVAFAAWPKVWAKGAGLLFGGLLWYAPSTRFARGDNPRFVEYHWRGLEVWAGNLYVFIGCGLLLLVLWRAFQVMPATRQGGSVLLSRPSFAAKHRL